MIRLLLTTFLLLLLLAPVHAQARRRAFKETVAASDSATNGLVRWYKMDENTGTALASSAPAENVNATLTGGAWDASGHFNSGLTFDGSGDNLDLGNAADIKFGAGDFTMMIWVRLDGVAFTQCALCDDDNGTPFRDLFLIDSGNAAVFQFRDSGGDQGTVTGTSNVGDGSWHHLAAVRSGSTFTLYVDGVSEGTPVTDAAIGNTDPAGGNLMAGARSAGDLILVGDMDQLRLFNVAKTVGEIGTLRTRDISNP